MTTVQKRIGEMEFWSCLNINTLSVESPVSPSLISLPFDTGYPSFTILPVYHDFLQALLLLRYARLCWLAYYVAWFSFMFL